MACILRASGDNFDVDAFVAKASIQIDSLWRKGEKRFPANKHSNLNQSSGVRLVASEADFSQLTSQIEDAIFFLHQNLAQIKFLASFPGVEGAVLDFGVEIYPPGWSSFTLPPELLALAGEARVSVCLSVYPTDHEEKIDA